MELKREFFKAGNVYRSEGGSFEGEFLYHADRYIYFKDSRGEVGLSWRIEKHRNWTLIKEKEETYTAEEVHEKVKKYEFEFPDKDTRSPIEFLNDEFPLPKEVFTVEAGKWIKSDNGSIVFVESVEGYYFTGYGVNIEGWHDSSGGWITCSFTQEATEEEVKEMLFKEAEKRGFKEGVYFKSVYDSSFDGVAKSNDFVFKKSNGGEVWMKATNGYNIQCFEGGKWAEIVEDTKLTELKKKYAELGAEIDKLENK